MKNIKDQQSIPKYFQISQDIIAQINCGKLKPGMKIPSENEIISQYRVSNTTARKILQHIESAGLASRVKGKGTYVTQRNIERSATRILGFTRNMIEAGHHPSTKLLDARKVLKGYSAVINGRRYSMKGPVYKIHRLRFADDIPMMLEVRYISLQFCPNIWKMDFKRSLYEIYERQYGLQLAGVNQMLSAIMLDSGVKDFFDIENPIPGFRVEGITFCGREMILEMEDSVYRGDKYRFSVIAKP
jgi:GntR family transcriptional regulator